AAIASDKLRTAPLNPTFMAWRDEAEIELSLNKIKEVCDALAEEKPGDAAARLSELRATLEVGAPALLDILTLLDKEVEAQESAAKTCSDESSLISQRLDEGSRPLRPNTGRTARFRAGCRRDRCRSPDEKKLRRSLAGRDGGQLDRS